MAAVQRIAILGAESTGKSWLAAQLAAALTAPGSTTQQQPVLVLEVLREWCERSGRTPLAHEQLAIAQEQARQALAVDASRTLIADTTPLMIAVYSHLLFNDRSLYPFALEHQRHYHLTLLTGLDLPWVADGLQREGPHVQGPVDELLRAALTGAGLAFQVVYGEGAERLGQALAVLRHAGLAEPAASARPEPTQNASRTGRTSPKIWRCDKCSDPDCEHRLFTRLPGLASSA